MVNKDVIREIFMKLESYDRINVISDILRFSNSLELEFYSSVIENILQYHKLSFNTLRDELNYDENLKSLLNSDCSKSDVRSKLISTLSLLKVSNVKAAEDIFEFLKQNHVKFKEQIHNNPADYEEIMLIYQLASEHPAFGFSHCQEIYDYLNQIRSLSISREYFSMDHNNEYFDDLKVISMHINGLHEYVFTIKVTWDHHDCLIMRTLEDIYQFYQQLHEMFPVEMKSGEICKLYLSCAPYNSELSYNLMSSFFENFMNSPPMILHCDFVRQFFKTRATDRQNFPPNRHQSDFNNAQTDAYQRFDSSSVTFTSSNNPSDNDDYPLSCDPKIGTPSSSDLSISINSNLLFDTIHTNRSCSDNGSDSFSVKGRRKKTRVRHSTGSSPINTPSDDSEICLRNESLRSRSNRFSRQLSMVLENRNMTSSFKELRTENWLSESNKTISGNDSSDSINIVATPIVGSMSPLEYDVSQSDGVRFDVSKIVNCQIGNLREWLRMSHLEQCYSYISQMKFGEFHLLSEELLTDRGVDREASKCLVTLIGRLKHTDIVQIDDRTVNIIVRELSNSVYSNASEKFLEQQKSNIQSQDLSNRYLRPMVYCNLVAFVPTIMINSADNFDPNHTNHKLRNQ